MDARSWLARLAFSFFIIAGVLLWEAYKLTRAPDADVSTGRLWLYAIAAAMSISLGVAGMRARHRRDR